MLHQAIPRALGGTQYGAGGMLGTKYYWFLAL